VAQHLRTVREHFSLKDIRLYDDIYTEGSRHHTGYVSTGKSNKLSNKVQSKEHHNFDLYGYVHRTAPWTDQLAEIFGKMS
jgi:hypothetical protein